MKFYNFEVFDVAFTPIRVLVKYIKYINSRVNE